MSSTRSGEENRQTLKTSRLPSSEIAQIYIAFWKEPASISCRLRFMCATYRSHQQFKAENARLDVLGQDKKRVFNLLNHKIQNGSRRVKDERVFVKR